MKKLVFNADDFGYSSGVNRGIIKAHLEGVVTSTSVMVFKLAASEASHLINYPQLSVGLHFDITGEGRKADLGKSIGLLIAKEEKIKNTFNQQIEKFIEITGKRPDHLDSHHHVHLHPRVRPIFEIYSQEYHIPVRAFPKCNFVGTFFGWDRLERQDLKRINVQALLKILLGLKSGVTEIMCHPGFVDQELLVSSKYCKERQVELETLTDPRVKHFIKESDIELCNWNEAE